MPSTPLIYCHFGNATFLPHVFSCVRTTNPGLSITLLGDESNAKVAKDFGIRHIPFESLHQGELIEDFEAHYQLIKGPEHNHLVAGRDLVKFVFLRWFYVYNYLLDQDIDSFWHFDTDNLILEPFHEIEHYYTSYDCTEQCNGMCLNGYIGSRSLVERYLKHINLSFKDNQLLDRYRHTFKHKVPKGAYTEMGAFMAFKSDQLIDSYHSIEPIEGRMLDDALCQAHGMQLTPNKVYESLENTGKVKVLGYSPLRGFVCYQDTDGNPVTMITINASWLRLSFYKLVWLGVCLRYWVTHSSFLTRIFKVLLGDRYLPFQPFMRTWFACSKIHRAMILKPYRIIVPRFMRQLVAEQFSLLSGS